MSDIKLLPCPFCGGEAGTVKHYQLDSPKAFWIAYCKKCQVRQYKGNINDGYLYQTETQAIKAWNTRKPMDRIVEQLEEKKKEYLDGFSTHKENELYGVACGFGDSIKIIKAGGKV